MPSSCPKCRRVLEEDEICCAQVRYTWRCKSCFKLTTGFAIPYGKCFMCGGELEVIPQRDMGDSMRFQAIRDAVQFELNSFHFYKLARDHAKTPDQRAVLERLAAPDMARRLVLSQDPRLGYFVTVYTGLRAWRSHDFNTPFVALRQAELDRFFATGQEVPEWQRRPLVVLLDDTGGRADAGRFGSAGFSPVATYGHYTILERPAS